MYGPEFMTLFDNFPPMPGLVDRSVHAFEEEESANMDDVDATGDDEAAHDHM